LFSRIEGQNPNPCAITLRMTFGSASSPSVAIGTQRIAAGHDEGGTAA
jgi:hypothetical protein